MQPSAPALVAILAFFVVVPEESAALRCFQCGQYNDGVGSITPCINYSEEKNLKECPSTDSNYCIKYVSGSSQVRDCIKECKESKIEYGTYVYCCNEDGCNPASVTSAPGLWFLATVAVGLALRL
ncbi:lymphocyte antigen 6D [Neocloeon triangulifer]|uniref:lymphocyte antigen 6D n=1 Tax=Neocloeon triangulifer TaxID=2078957 RepID=UPI00286F7901|nr:lymphocyte antigen 6D [Neocloeon triangulifer]